MAKATAKKEVSTSQTNASKNTPANGKPASKMEAVRWTLDELGKDAKPVQIQEYVQKQFKLPMTIATVSNYKGTILKKADDGSKKRGRKKGSKNAVKTEAVPVANKAGISLDDIRAVKELADRLGAVKLRSLAEVLAK